MPSTQFSDDLKYMLRGMVAGTRRACASMLIWYRALPPGTRTRFVLVGGTALVFVIALGLRAGKTPATSLRPPAMRTATMHFSRPHGETREMTAVGQRSLAVGKAQQSQGSYKDAAASYAAAAKHGDARGLAKLIAMTRSQKCSERAGAADALAGIKDKRAVAALQKLERAQFKDEPRNPGIFACDSHRAAQKALEQHGHG
ncbi:MAG TPA: hypothetical protein VFE90_05705 [Myxococcales bacterium]|jgi:hypothetical protein|nr:hypothetical protein [Myxococcales bacterium]